ncbi:Mu-like prophage major head subunit gpT family protein [Erythrobacter sp. NFXS35]|uniref:prohead protease/major capsid protein fusion protein n=1 Tax=Erythrobacter sp. NFXS35 TaxID=2818436 RepID=UPI0032DFAC07
MPMTDHPPEGQITVAAPQRTRAAQTRPSSYQEEDNSLEVVWSTGAEVTRFDWWDWEYYTEELAMEPGAVRLDRLNAGAAVLDTHNSGQLSAVIGSIVIGSVRIENGQGIARVALSDTDDVKDTVAKIRAGHIRNISVGYIVHQYTRIEREGERPIMRADDWEPTEISFVPVPADAGAQVRSSNAEQGGFPCIIRGIPADSTEENTMATPNQGVPAGDAGVRDQQQPAPAPVITPGTTPETEERAAPPASVNARRIRDVVSRSNLGSDFALDLLARNEETPLTESQLTDAIAERLEQNRNTTPINQNRVGDRGIDSPAYRSAMEHAIVLRAGGTIELTEPEREAAREFRGMRLTELARFHLEQEGISTRGMNPLVLAGTALGLARSGMHTTSDFAQILSNAANKQLRRGYEAAPQTFRPFITTGTLPDFKPAPLVGVGDAPQLLLVQENGEFKYGTMSDFGDTYKLATYGRIIAITRQTIINDDLNVFARVPAGFGAQAAQLESDLVYAQLLANPNMYDGTALFHADHGNLAASGGAINETTLAAGEQAMLTQTSPEGTQLNLMPMYLIVGPAKKVEAQKMLTAVTPNATSGVNPFQNSMTLIVEARITGNAWYLAADPMMIDTIRLDSLEGQEGVYSETRIGFDVDGVEMKARVDRVAKAVDWRGLYRNPGN